MYRYAKFIFIFILSLLMWATAQSLVINGQIIDGATQQPVSDAIVIVENTWQYTYTNSQGKFQLSVSEPGSYLLHIIRLGYREKYVKLKLDTKNITTSTIQLTPAPYQAEEILVSGKRNFNIPRADISEQEILENAPKDVGELFKGYNGFGVIRKGGYAVDPVFRSFKYEQINVQFDGGVRVSPACPNRMDPVTTHVQAEDIQKVEIVKGPFSVRYGQTLGGVINLVMKRPPITENFQIHSEVESGYESNGNGKTGRIAVTASHPLYDIYLSAGSKDFSDYQSGSGFTVPSAFRVNDYSLKVGFNPRENHRLQLSWRQSFARDVLHAGLPMDTRKDDTNIFALDYSVRKISNKIISLNTKFYFSEIDHLMDNHLRPNYAMVQAVSNVKSYTRGGRLELAINLFSNNLWYLGADIYHVRKEGTRIREVYKNACTGMVMDPPKRFEDDVWQNSALTDVGIFSEWQQTLTPRLFLLGGIRADIVSATANRLASQFVDAYGTIGSQQITDWSATTSLSYQPSEGSVLRISLGRGSRSPNLIERYINHQTVGQDAYEYFGNPFLKSEINNQVEISFTQQTKYLNLQGSIFYSDIRNYITARVDTDLPRLYMPCKEPKYTRRFVNVNHARQIGFDMQVTGEIKKQVTYRIGAAYTRGDNLDWNEPLPEVPPLEVKSAIRYTHPTYRWWLELGNRLVARQNRFSPSFAETETPGFSVFNLQAGVKPNRHIEINVAVHNLFNRDYYEHLNRRFVNSPLTAPVFEPGRNITTQIRIRL